MGRPERDDPAGGWHHVMNRGVDHGTIFFDDVDRVEFVRLLGVMCGRFGVEVHAYCLVGNHFHLLVRCPDGGLSDAMHLLGSLFARFVNDRRGRDGPLFKSRFTSRHITTEAYLANVVRYIHRNALDIAGIEHPRDYRWSSHRAYLRLRQRPAWLVIDEVASWFATVDEFDAFVAGDLAVDPDHRTPADGSTGGSVRQACEIVVAERGGSAMTVRRSHVKALTLAVADASSAHLTASIHDEFGLVDGALRSAQSRARKRQADEEFEHLLSAVWELIAA